MAKSYYAILDDAGVVTQVIVAGPEFIAKRFPGAVDVSEDRPAIGSQYDARTKQFTRPADVEDPPSAEALLREELASLKLRMDAAEAKG